MSDCERGFTLVETVIVVGILALLLAAGGVWLLGTHPGALAQAADDYDAALASARAIAATSGNGATIVFAPRASGSQTPSGFALRVYRGRPTALAAVQATTAMPVVSDATVFEKTLGKPPFAIFIGASGHVSGEASYPKIDRATGNATFGVIAAEPACPSGGLVLTFTSAQQATATRALPCLANVVGSPGAPNPSPTPNLPLVTPASLTYRWPAAAEQTFVATEWGYTHWFATTDRFACGSGVGSFPNVLPSPYTPPATAAEAAASPHPPANTPYSYPNSLGDSMNDAPASFPLDPVSEGLCTAAVADDYGQTAQTSVQVMGWLTAAYGSNAYTHVSPSQLALPASAFAQKGASATIALSKAYDAEPLQPQIAFDAACSPYVGAGVASGTTPHTPSSTPAKASITLTLTTLPQSATTCGGTIYDQYPGSKNGEGIAFNLTIQPPQAATWPPAVQYPLPGSSLTGASGNAVCAVNQPRAFAGSGFNTALANARDPFGVGFTTDSKGCLVSPSGKPVDTTKDADVGRSALVNESGYTGTFKIKNNSCASILTIDWQPTGAGGPTAGLVAEAAQKGSCSLSVTDSSNTINADGSNTVNAQVKSVCGSSCYAVVEVYKYAAVWGCDPGTAEACSGGVPLGQDIDALTEWYDSTNGGTTWDLIGSCKQTEHVTETKLGVSPPYSWTVTTIDLYGCGKATDNPAMSDLSTGTPPPPPSWIPASTTYGYADNQQYPCKAVGGLGGCSPANPSNPPAGWQQPGAPPGTSGIVIPSVPVPN